MDVDRSPRIHSAPVPGARIANDIRRYRRIRRARQLDPQLQTSRVRPRNEAEELIRFAHIWAPYGGAPAEEIFPQFGITTTEFVARLWHAIGETRCDPALVQQLSVVYPPHQAA